jgi:integrase
MATAANEPGHVGGIAAGDWWLSLLLAVYWSACRIGALLRTPSASYDARGTLLVRNQKNHKAQLYQLPASCCEVIDATDPGSRVLLWPWPWHRNQVWIRMRRICEASGIRSPRGDRQLFHRLRRTTLSLCAAVDPAIAQRQAGHRDYATTQKH